MSYTFRFTKLLARVSVLNSTRSLATVSRRQATNAPPSVPYFIFTNNPWVWQKPEPLRLPILNYIKPLILPDDLLKIPPFSEPSNSITNKVIEDPLMIANNSKEAARLIVIRRKKMKKHKLKKLRKRMKYEWAKVRQRRELKKEKEFQAGLIAQCKEAEAFSAEEYVANKIKQAAEKPPPRFQDTEEYKELMRHKKLRLYQYTNLAVKNK